ncbi:TetR/AcrR family transcriptional regulator [Nocardia sp. NBC_01388]|uniref:TetR/AcrR family transcriptional regulator n=1 Tax=Nocardia sp. NBC_01388 TaxID=2903596 RepID=UPI0032520DD6
MTRPGAPLSNLLTRAVSHVLRAGSATTDRDDQVLDAALTVLARRGTREATMDEVAAESGVGRATLFRRFGGKDQLFERALAREFARLLDTLAERFQTVTDPADQVVEAFAACLHLMDHPLFATDDPHRRGELIQALGHGDPSPMSLAHKAFRANIAHAQATGTLPPGDPDLQADALIHLALGYLAVPSLTIDLTDPAAVERLARTAIAPILTGSALPIE